MIKNYFYLVIIIFHIAKYSLNIFGKTVSDKYTLSFPSSTEVNGFISNDLTHETFSEETPGTNEFEPSIFFIIGKNKIKSFYFTINSVNNDNEVEDLTYDLYSISSSYLFIPKDLIYDSNSYSQAKSVLFGLCTNNHFISSYIFEYTTDANNFLLTQKLSNKNLISYEDLKTSQTDNKCSGSSFIGKINFGDKLYVSNAYSKYSNDNEVMNIHYEIKIFEYKAKTYELNYYVGKSLKIEIINYSTSPPSNFNTNTKEFLRKLLNKQGVSLIKCTIINSFINYIQNDYYYDKEIIILCLYYSKDLVNSLENDPKFSIRLDLFKNDIGSNDLKLISGISIKNSIMLDRIDNNAMNYLYPSLITYKSENEIYVILKGARYSEIYSVEINMRTLMINNLIQLESFNDELLLSNNYEHFSFNVREFIGSFYIVKYNSDTKIISIFIYGDKNKKIFEDTEIKINIGTSLSIPTSNIIRIETTTISNVLLGILFVT